MSNALRKQRDELLEQELNELKGKTPEQEEEKKINTELEDPEENTFRKRYGDLRRHVAKLEQEWKDKEAALLQRVEEKSVTLPKTKEELAAWSAKYPDLYKVFQSMIMEREQVAISQMKEELKKVDTLKADLQKERAMKELLKAHADFPEIAQSKEFHEWLATKSKAMQNVMYEDGADVNDAIDIVSMYKNLTAPKKEPEKKKPDQSAARAVPAGTRSAPAFEGEHIFSESEVEAMNEREYLKHEAEIKKQIADRKFIYDRSGAAR